ncbi:hypothetical protein E3Q18_03654 [Wallemia mellicola]|uniref:Uncharacterized protein n=1 Tax=Wallemia mellicola TaxID=1708541 RepID=A0A4T0NF89_9BASI|nr:hypothetical protein E3Q18_03654 [Wallemia mellicola]TIC01954.1 hypothetical protein E3Q16_03653 [Wallemia mellicola]TIC27756.1 hypothetical protein E3Q10_03567 [Wallemia mellicola]
MVQRLVNPALDTVFTRSRTTTKIIDIKLFDISVHSIHDVFLFSKHPRLTSSLYDMGRKWGAIMRYYPPEIVKMSIPPISLEFPGNKATGAHPAISVIHEIALVAFTNTFEGDIVDIVSFDLTYQRRLCELMLPHDGELIDNSLRKC